MFLHAEMAQDREHEQALQERADSLIAEQQQLQKRLEKLQQELELQTEATQQTAAGMLLSAANFVGETCNASCADPLHISTAVSSACFIATATSVSMSATASQQQPNVLLVCPADVASRRAEYELRVGKLDELHNLYKNCLGLTLTPLEGENMQQQHTPKQLGMFIVHGSSSSGVHCRMESCLPADQEVLCFQTKSAPACMQQHSRKHPGSASSIQGTVYSIRLYIEHWQDSSNYNWWCWVYTGELLLEFTQIDPEEPSRPFSFAVQVVGDKEYEGGQHSVAAAGTMHP